MSRLLPRPSIFHAEDREKEILQWRDWDWSLRQNLVVVDGNFQEELTKLDSKEQERSRFLYSLLGSLIQGRLLGIIKNVDN